MYGRPVERPCWTGKTIEVVHWTGKTIGTPHGSSLQVVVESAPYMREGVQIGNAAQRVFVQTVDDAGIGCGRLGDAPQRMFGTPPEESLANTLLRILSIHRRNIAGLFRKI